MTKIFKYMAPYFKSVIVVLFLLGIQAYCDLKLPQYTSAIIDNGIMNVSGEASVRTDYILSVGIEMLAVTLVAALATVLNNFLASRVGAGIGRSLREKVFTRVMFYSSAELNKFSTASLITRSTNDIQQIQMVSTILLRIALFAPIMGCFSIIKVVQTGAGMTWVIAIAVAALMSMIAVLIIFTMPKFKIMQTLIDRLNLVSREILTGLNVIRAFRREEREEERFDIANRELTSTQLFTNRMMSIMQPGMMLIMNGTTVLITWVAAKKIDLGTMQVGTMTAFIMYAMHVVMSFLFLTMLSIMLPRAGVAAERIEEVLKQGSSVADAANAEPLKVSEGRIEFDHVDFLYPDARENVLDDIHFTAEPGETTAFIGSTGSGKSTLVNLIPRFYDVTKGSIKIDGQDLREVTLESLRDAVGFVPQKAVLFSGTIKSNLRFGNEDATEDDLKKATDIAQASEFIEGKKDGFDSSIAQGGSNVSGGQKQRLAIARALVKDPKILVFDDSFSALDMRTDAALRNELSKQIKDKTVLIVAQRISTIIHADKIVVLDEGKIVGIGKHEDLIRSCEVYEQIARSQLSAKELGLEEEGA